jgi:hypothetical protein
MVIWMQLTGRPVWQVGATQRFQRQPFSTVTHSTPS